MLCSKSRLLAASLIGIAVAASHVIVPHAAVGAGSDVEKTTVMVPMHDGVHLATDIYRSESQKGPLPVIFMRTPYNKDGNKSFSAATAPHGYVLVVQDMRGRFASEGNDSVVFHNDGWGSRRDGQESVEWIARQPWCNGSIATYGGSALGITQTMLAPGAPAALKAQYVQVAFDDMYSQGTYQGGAWRKSLIEWWLKATKFDPRQFKDQYDKALRKLVQRKASVVPSRYCAPLSIRKRPFRIVRFEESLTR